MATAGPTSRSIGRERWLVRPEVLERIHWPALGYTWGAAGDVPVPGDYDGDGRTDIAVFRPGPGTGSSVSRRRSTPQQTLQWGGFGDTPVPGDYDGDGKMDAAIYRPSNGLWSFLKSSHRIDDLDRGLWGAAGDVPMPGDFDGDGRTDIVVFRPVDRRTGSSVNRARTSPRGSRISGAPRATCRSSPAAERRIPHRDERLGSRLRIGRKSSQVDDPHRAAAIPRSGAVVCCGPVRAADTIPRCPHTRSSGCGDFRRRTPRPGRLGARAAAEAEGFTRVLGATRQQLDLRDQAAVNTGSRPTGPSTSSSSPARSAASSPTARARRSSSTTT